MQLDTRPPLPKFVDRMNVDIVGSWLCILSTYFNTSPQMEEAKKLQITSLQLKGVAQTWWDTHLDSA